MMRRLAVVVGGLLFGLNADLSVAAQSFTLEQVLSAPFSSELQASPQGGRFSWIANQEGKRAQPKLQVVGKSPEFAAFRHARGSTFPSQS